MKTFTIATILAASASLISASPAAEAETVEKRAITNVSLCLNQNFGDCSTLAVTRGGGCYNFPDRFNDKVSSLRTGGADVTCSFFLDGSCRGAVYTVKGAHPTLPAQFNDKLSSVRCA